MKRCSRSIFMRSVDAIKGAAQYTGSYKNTLDGINASVKCQYGVMTQDLRTSSFGIIDTVKNTWVLRLDNAHKGANYPHFNINEKLTGVLDPHTPVPQEVVDAGSKVTDAIRFVKEAAPYVAGAIATAQMVGAVAEDVQDMSEGKNSVPKNSLTTASSLVGGMYGASFGATGGCYIGGVIGWGIGAIFGPLGAVSGNAVGSLAGAVVGGVKGADVGRKAAHIMKYSASSADLLLCKLHKYLFN